MEGNSVKLGHDLPVEGEDCDKFATGAENVVVDQNSDNGSMGKVIRKTADIKIVEHGADFESFLLKEQVIKGLKRANFHRPSPIQLKAIPLGRIGHDMVVQAKSGTGKTCVFSVLALEAVEPSNSATQVLIIAPTREIALQINEAVTTIGHFMIEKKKNEFTGVTERKDGIKIECFIGGTTLQADREKSRLQKCQIVVGTPGRVWQLISEGDLSLDAIRLFVLDEADKLMEDSYQNDINSIYAHLPKGKQLVVTSATYPQKLDEFLSRYMKMPQFVKLDAADVQLLGVKQYILSMEKEERSDGARRDVPEFDTWLDKKIDYLNRVLSRVLFSQCLIFCNYQDKVEVVYQKLVTAYKWPAAQMSSNLSQSQRTSVLRRLKNVQIRMLVSTDVMARGIDAENVNLVVNFDVPRDAQTYFHRIGRAGRFGGYGAAISLLTNRSDELKFYTLASENGFQAKRLCSIDDVPSNLVENVQFFTDQPNLDIPDLGVLKKAIEKREKHLQQNRRGGQASANVQPLIEGWDEYAKIMQMAGCVERWSPTEFAWETNKDDHADSIERENGKRRQYSRDQMLAILKESLPSFPPSRSSIAQSGERDASPPTIEPPIRGVRIDLNALFARYVEKTKEGEAASAYLPTELLKEEQGINYVDDFISNQPDAPADAAGVSVDGLSDQPANSVQLNEPVKSDQSIRKYGRDELLVIKPFCVRAYAEQVFNIRNLLYTFEKKKKKRPKNERKQSDDNKAEPVETQKAVQPMVDIRKDYDEAILRATESPFCRFFGDCTLRLQEAAVKSRQPSQSVQASLPVCVDKAVQTDETIRIQPGRINVAYDHDQMIAIWRTVANPKWSPRNREYPWIGIVKENELLVERYAELEPEEEPEEILDEEEPDEEADEELEENVYGMIADYRETLKNYNKVLSEYRKAFRAYH